MGLPLKTSSTSDLISLLLTHLLNTSPGQDNCQGWVKVENQGSHLSKHPSDLKQNGTQEKTPFSSTVFHALSHGVIRFVASVSSKKHLLPGWNSSTANQKLLFNGF